MNSFVKRSIVLFLAIGVNSLYAGWSITTPTNMQQFSETSAINGAGTTDHSSTGFSVYIERVFSGNWISEGSDSGYSSALSPGSTWSGGSNAPTNGWPGISAQYRLRVVGAVGGDASVDIEII